MATARADPLRSTLDNLELDPRSESDRPYLIAMLRRLGYTERDIDEVIRTGKMPTTAPTADAFAPARDYKLVVPASDTRFALDSSGRAGSDAPFEDLERLEFEDEDGLVFEEMQPSEEVSFEDVSDESPSKSRWAEEDLQAQEALADETPAERTLREKAVRESGFETPKQRALRERAAQAEQAERDAGFASAPIDTFGDPDAVHGTPRTRVRVRRVRAGSKEEAERKVEGKSRHVIKSVPVDIVERWGADTPTDQGRGRKGA